ncbi:DUF305 family protein family protein [Streptomyces sp. BK208]|uniref:DUF305 domain-containing protein n=1 Tax=Streptomyces sp. BK208 TaxID=2512150 RepID=UPI0010620A9A|nr:DUF305 domain-containing protein [Streptomyces sp. BK208]TDT42911.1 DUF305 family protein family protein [Streptomyces sp. BK208]
MQLSRNVLTRRTAAALLLGMAVAGCTSQPAADRPAPAAFNDTDTAWIQLMIPMNERASLLTDLAPAHAGRPVLADWAEEAGRRMKSELADLRELLAAPGVPDTRPHEGHNMPGMVTLDTVRRARAVRGESFDRLLAGSLRAHLVQVRMLCASERTAGSSERATGLATVVERSVAQRITRLDALTGGDGGG